MSSNSAKALGQFLKSRRERLQPEQAGITDVSGRRRTPGLRREEVAYLANVVLGSTMVNISHAPGK